MNADNSKCLPQSAFKTFKIASDFTSCVNVVADLMSRKEHAELKVLGMDCEFVQYDKTQEPVLLQLAHPSKHCALFQIGRMKTQQKLEWEQSEYAKIGMTPENLALANAEVQSTWSDDEKYADSLYARFRPPFENILKEILEDASILKVGVGIHGDVMWLERYYGIVCKGWLDVRFLADDLDVDAGCLGLDELADKVLGLKKVNLKKKKKSPIWTSDVLSQNQINYAGTDVTIGLLVFLKLNDQKINQEYDFLSRMDWDDKTYWSHTVGLWGKYTGKVFKYKNLNESKPTNAWISSLDSKDTQRDVVLESAISSRNHVLQRGNISCASKQSANGCVVCGKKNRGQSFSTRPVQIIPVDYNISSLDSFDPCQYLCLRCIKKWQDEVQVLREELTIKCGGPSPAYDDKKLYKAKERADKILFDKGFSFPKTQLRNELCNLFRIPITKSSILDEHTLLTILSMDCWFESDHGAFVREHFARTFGKTGGDDRLRFFWCHGFSQKMKPRYLSNSWNVYLDDHLDFKFHDICSFDD